MTPQAIRPGAETRKLRKPMRRTVHHLRYGQVRRGPVRPHPSYSAPESPRSDSDESLGFVEAGLAPAAVSIAVATLIPQLKAFPPPWDMIATILFLAASFASSYGTIWLLAIFCIDSHRMSQICSDSKSLFGYREIVKFILHGHGPYWALGLGIVLLFASTWLAIFVFVRM